MIDYFNPNDPWKVTGYDPFHGLNEKQRRHASCMGAIAYAAAVFVMFVILALLSSCTTTKYVPVIEHHTDTLIKTNVQRDSVYVHDSISVTQKGDTIRIDRWHTKYVDREVHDTLYQAVHDSIPKPYPVEVEVPAELTWWQRFRISLANILLWLVGIVGLYYLLRWVWKRKRWF